MSESSVDDGNTSRARPQRRGRDARRAQRQSAAASSVPFIRRQISPVDMLSSEAIEVIEHQAEILLEEIGLEF
ncbi:MAG: trimethylamine methyltransferase family protein, partial [Pseudomonadota bacterium]